jgi:WD40 repeat protein
MITLKAYDKDAPGLSWRKNLVLHINQIESLAWSPDGEKLASGGLDGVVAVWDWKNERLKNWRWYEQDPFSDVGCVAWTLDGQTLASGCGYHNAVVKIWNAQDGRVLKEIEVNAEFINNLDWGFSEGDVLALGCSNGSVLLWEKSVEQTRPILELESNDQITKLAWSPDRQKLAIGSARNFCRWDANTERVQWQSANPSAYISSMSWSPDNRIIATGYNDKIIRLWHADSGQQINILESHDDLIAGLSFSFDGRLLASISTDSLLLWRCDTWKPIVRFVMGSPLDGMYEGLSFHPKLPILASPWRPPTAEGERTARAIQIWDLDFDTLLNVVREI